MMMSNKNSYALLNHAIIKIPGPLNSPVRDGSVNPFFSTRWMSKTVLAVSRVGTTKSQYRLFDSISRCKGSAI